MIPPFRPYQPLIELVCDPAAHARVICNGTQLCGEEETSSGIAPTLGNYAPVGGVVGTVFVSAPISYGGSPTLVFELVGGVENVLPAGWTFNTSTGVITGTPSTAGVYPITVRLTNGVGAGAEVSTVLTMTSVLALPSFVGYDITFGLGGESMTMTPQGVTGSGLLTFDTVNDLPLSLELDPATGIISGPLVYGQTTSASVNVTVSNAAGTSAPVNVVITVKSPPRLSGYFNRTATVDVEFTSTPIVTGSPTITYSIVGTLPTGLSFNLAGTGLITGTPTVSGQTSTVTITASNTFGADASMTIVLNTVDDSAPIMWGKLDDVNASETDLKNNFFGNPASSRISAVRGGTYDFAAGVQAYAYICIPAALGVATSMKLPGNITYSLESDAPFTSGAGDIWYQALTISVNPSGTLYHVYRSNQRTAGAFTLTIT